MKYIGSTTDQELNGSDMTTNILSEANARLKFLYRQKSFLGLEARKALCSALIMCYLDYSSTSWYSGLSKMLMKKLQTCQNKVVRCILWLSPRSHIGPVELGRRIGWLDVAHRVAQLKLKLVLHIIAAHHIFRNIFSGTIIDTTLGQVL